MNTLQYACYMVVKRCLFAGSFRLYCYTNNIHKQRSDTLINVQSEVHVKLNSSVYTIVDFECKYFNYSRLIWNILSLHISEKGSDLPFKANGFDFIYNSMNRIIDPVSNISQDEVSQLLNNVSNKLLQDTCSISKRSE